MPIVRHIIPDLYKDHNHTVYALLIGQTDRESDRAITKIIYSTY